MNFRLITVLLFVSGCLVLTCDSAYASKNVDLKKETIVFLNWSEYIDPELVQEFEKKFSSRVKEIYFETDEMKDEMLLASNSEGFDIVLGSAISLIPYARKGWLSPLNASIIPNIKHIDPRWLNINPKLKGWIVPYLWGTVGIAYRKDLVKEKISSWKQLFQPAEYLKGKIIMIKDSRDVIGAALKSSGCSLNSEDQSQYDEIEKMLLNQKPFVKMYSYMALTEKSALVTGEVSMAMLYNGDALALQRYNPNIEFSVPKEGTSLWADCLVVMKSSKHKKLAYDFINFLNEPENAARLSSYLMFATPNKSAEKYLDSEHLKNAMIYPDKTVLEKSEFCHELSPAIIKKRNSIFSKIIQ